MEITLRKKNLIGPGYIQKGGKACGSEGDEGRGVRRYDGQVVQDIIAC